MAAGSPIRLRDIMAQTVAGTLEPRPDITTIAGRFVITGTIPDPQASRQTDVYGYYDNQGLWHAGTTNPSKATGYYDRNNVWVAGRPNGHYDEGGSLGVE
jgi:hypothetical protein